MIRNLSPRMITARIQLPSIRSLPVSLAVRPRVPFQVQSLVVVVVQVRPTLRPAIHLPLLLQPDLLPSRRLRLRGFRGLFYGLVLRRSCVSFDLMDFWFCSFYEEARTSLREDVRKGWWFVSRTEFNGGSYDH